MSTPAEPDRDHMKAVPPLRSPRQELEAYVARRLGSLRRVDAAEAQRLEEAMRRAVQILEEAEAEAEDDPQ